jgi:hypothetical protein
MECIINDQAINPENKTQADAESSRSECPLRKQIGRQ